MTRLFSEEAFGRRVLRKTERAANRCRRLLLVGLVCRAGMCLSATDIGETASATIPQLSVYVRYQFGGPLVNVVGERTGFQEIVLAGENTYSAEVEGKKFSATVRVKEVASDHFLTELELSENVTKSALDIKRSYPIEYQDPQKIVLNPDTTVEFKIDNALHAAFERVSSDDLRGHVRGHNAFAALGAEVQNTVGDARMLSLKEARNPYEAALLILGYSRGSGCTSVVLVTTKEKLNYARFVGMNLRFRQFPEVSICVQP